MKFYRIKPFDTVVFGENKSSVAGDDHEKGSKFPPEIMKLFNLGKVKFFGIFPIYGENVLLSAPADLLGKRKSKGGPYHIPKVNGISKNSIVDFETDLGVGSLPWVDAFEELEKVNGYVDVKGFRSIMDGRLDYVNVFSESDLFERELRIGISLDFSTGTVQESMLYAHFHLRVKEGFLIALSNGVNAFMMTIGGERKVSRIQEEEGGLGLKGLMDGKIRLEKGKRYKFYLTTHAFLNGNLKPGSEITIGSALDNSSDGIRMRVEWVYSAGAEWISGVEKEVDENGELRKKPAVYMLKPATVIVLTPKDDGGEISRLAQIKEPVNFDIGSPEGRKIDKNRFIERGWGSGIIWEIK